MEEKGRFTRTKENFTCVHCGEEVEGTGFTDHCPKCLYGLHVDVNPGDRMSDCKGVLVPKSVVHDRGTYIITYQCQKCKARIKMKSASGDNAEELERLQSMTSLS